MTEESYTDCIVIGAGISGLDAAYHLQKHCSWASFVLLERRSNIGGTWDFFKFPGLRSDSDMYTFGFSWKAWESPKPIAPVDDIMRYLTEAAEQEHIMEKIKFNVDVASAQWTSSDNLWHLVTRNGDRYCSNFLLGSTGYYSYENPYIPEFPGREKYLGTLVHPQQWLPEHDHMIRGKKVVVVGSGATAVTIVPSIKDIVSHVTMVQRTPTYILPTPSVDSCGVFCSKWLPTAVSSRLNRWKSISIGSLVFWLSMRCPQAMKKIIKKEMFQKLGNAMSVEEFERHFSPPYTPWQQRLCLSPDGDIFEAVREGKASIVTGNIDHLTESGIKMKSGEHVDADVIITATGLSLQRNLPFSTITTSIDGDVYRASDHWVYRGVMLNDVPNFGFILGYANAAWTLKADVSALYFTRLMNHMRSNRFVKVVPRLNPKDGVQESTTPDGNINGLKSGYVARASATLFKQGDRGPWIGGTSYIADYMNLGLWRLNRKSLEFTSQREA
eukprot:CAMPEP_0194543360 /NCGR_PEP_ID=MMETSP0253-20130528/85660_1 /TAXON_ID=2966 /ORGANISM="Noctiluca scintillans" /LENGTH=498 /DNA_ID=CAMNT_0039390113 /DNA_START=33 /DNA_END=1529 /DNA_ORIENTATION=-